MAKHIKTCLYRHAKEEIRKLIQIMRKRHDYILPSQQELCRKLNVSRITISRAILELKMDGYLEPARDLRRVVIAERERREESPRTFCLLAKDLTHYLHNAFFQEIIKAVQDKCAELNISLSLAGCIVNEKGESIESSLIKKGFSGIIALMVDECICRDLARKMPLVLIADYLVWESGFSAVTSGTGKGAYEGTKYLLGLGHERIALVKSCKKDMHPSGLELYQGYKKALQEAGKSVDYELILEYGYSAESGRKASERIVEMTEKPTAVFCGSDDSAIGLVEGLKKKGWMIPEEISVLGFDDTHLVERFDPPLTTVRVEKEMLGAAAVQELLRKTENPAGPNRQIVVYPRVMERKTCLAAGKVLV